MEKFKITINNLDQPASAEIGIIVENKSEAEGAYGIICSQKFTRPVEVKLLDDVGQPIEQIVITGN